MKIYKVDEQNKKILIEIPITTPTGKIRIKERKSYTDFGLPVATRQRCFNENMYVEWQIGYDLEINSKNIENSTFHQRTEINFIAYNGKRKILYELSEYFYYFYKMGVFNTDDIKGIVEYLTSINNSNLIENLYTINKSYPNKKTINGIKFLESVISYPHLIHDFNNGFFIISEITIREKQKAVGLQPMLYICFLVSYLKDNNGKTFIDRTAEKNEKAIFEFNQQNAFIIKESFKIFGILSESHKHDIITILNLIRDCGSVHNSVLP
jgi:hypothetical protein